MGYRKYRSYNNYSQKRYRSHNRGPDVGDMLAEMFVALIVLLGKLIYKLFVLLAESFQGRMKTHEAFHLNTTTAPADPVLSSLQNPEEETLVQKKSYQETELQEPADSRYHLNKSLVTSAEENFFEVLERAVGNSYRIVPQVPLSGIVSPNDSNGHFTNYGDFNRISAKKIDFVLYEKLSWTPCLAIELDDSSHRRWDRIKRDHFVNDLMDGVGLGILHVPVGYSYDVEELKEHIAEKIQI